MAPFRAMRRLGDGRIDLPFRAAAQTVQEAVLNALCAAPATEGREGRHFPSLAGWAQSGCGR